MFRVTLLLLVFIATLQTSFAQVKTVKRAAVPTATGNKDDMLACQLKDDLRKNMPTIQTGALRLAKSNRDCVLALLDALQLQYRDSNQLQALNSIAAIYKHLGDSVPDYFSEFIDHEVKRDFGHFINDLFNSKTLAAPLEKELISLMNTIVSGKPMKNKYIGLMNVEIEKARDKKDNARMQYIQRLKQRIVDERY